MRTIGAGAAMCALVVAAAAGVAAAYVPGSRAIVRRYAEMQALTRVWPSPLVGSARSFDRLRMSGGGAADSEVRLEISADGCRTALQTPQGTAYVYLVGGKMTKSGPVVPALEALASLGCPLLTLHNEPAVAAEEAVTRFALGIGVDFNVSALSRMGGRFGYVVGANPGDLSRPQVWFDQETNQPLRVIGNYGGQLWDVRFIDSGSIATNRLAPRLMAVWAGGERQMELRLMAQAPKLAGDEALPIEPDEDGD